MPIYQCAADPVLVDLGDHLGVLAAIEGKKGAGQPPDLICGVVAIEIPHPYRCPCLYQPADDTIDLLTGWIDAFDEGNDPGSLCRPAIQQMQCANDWRPSGQ